MFQERQLSWSLSCNFHTIWTWIKLFMACKFINCDYGNEWQWQVYILFCVRTGPVYLKEISQILVEVQMLFHWYENSLVLLMGQHGRIDFISSPMSQFLKLENVWVKIMDLYLPSHSLILLRGNSTCVYRCF